jgi:hypothetical protein
MTARPSSRKPSSITVTEQLIQQAFTRMKKPSEMHFRRSLLPVLSGKIFSLPLSYGKMTEKM